MYIWQTVLYSFIFLDLGSEGQLIWTGSPTSATWLSVPFPVCWHLCYITPGAVSMASLKFFLSFLFSFLPLADHLVMALKSLCYLFSSLDQPAVFPEVIWWIGLNSSIWRIANRQGKWWVWITEMGGPSLNQYIQWGRGQVSGNTGPLGLMLLGIKCCRS